MARLRKRDAILEERRDFELAAHRIAVAYAEEDKKFEEWKDGVLVFEHSEFSSDDNSVSDDRICDGESVWSTENEDIVQ